MKEEFINKHPDTTFETPVTVGLLLDYTSEVLLPAMDEMIKKNNVDLEHRLKSHIDRHNLLFSLTPTYAQHRLHPQIAADHAFLRDQAPRRH